MVKRDIVCNGNCGTILGNVEFKDGTSEEKIEAALKDYWCSPVKLKCRAKHLAIIVEQEAKRPQAIDEKKRLIEAVNEILKEKGLIPNTEVL